MRNSRAENGQISVNKATLSGVKVAFCSKPVSETAQLGGFLSEQFRVCNRLGIPKRFRLNSVRAVSATGFLWTVKSLLRAF